jgi:hypothetical protein
MILPNVHDEPWALARAALLGRFVIVITEASSREEHDEWF